jgi:hypothetical protein
MSSSTYVRLALAVALLVAGCSSATGSGTATTAIAGAASSPPSVGKWPCLAQFGARETTTADGVRVAIIGHSRSALVLSNESDEDACGWLPYVTALRSTHAMLAFYDYTSDDVSDLESVVRLVRARGARAITLVGASEGAKASIVAAARVAPGAVVSLSAEARLRGQAVAPFAARLHMPVLFATATDDPYGATSATRELYRVAPSRSKQLVTAPGDAHGTTLLGVARIRHTVVAFLAAHHG